MGWRWPSQNTFGMWTELYWTRSSRTKFGVSIHVSRLAGDTLDITCNFLYCDHQGQKRLFDHPVYTRLWFPITVKNNRSKCWDVMPRMLKIGTHFSEKHVASNFSVKNTGSQFLRSTDKYIPDHTSTHPKRIIWCFSDCAS